MTRAADPAVDLRKPTQLIQDGKLDVALKELEQLYAEYQIASGPEFSSIALARARAIEQAAQGSSENADPTKLVEAEKCYRAVIERGSPNQRWAARNNLAVQLIRLNRPSDGASVFLNTDIAAADPTQRFICYYNFGRTLELSDRRSDALSQYMLSVKEAPTFDLAAEAASRLIYVDDLHAKEALDLSQRLHRKGQYQAAAKHIHAGVTKFARSDRGPLFMRELAIYYLDANLSSEAFSNAEWNGNPEDEIWPGLAEVAKRSDLIADYAADLRTVFMDSFSAKPEPLIRRFRVIERDRAFAPVLSGLLKQVGDQLASPQPSKAIGRYWAAWNLDWNNTDAALRLAAILKDRAKDVDPDGDLHDQFIRQLFDAKGGEYMKPIKTAKDWQNIQRIHVALGSIFAAEKKWGAPNSENQDPRTAVFQFSHAVKAEEELKKLSSQYTPSPGVWILMADCYRRFEANEKAFELYDLAATTYIKTFKNRLAAEEVINRFNKMSLGPKEKDRFDALKAELKTLPAFKEDGVFSPRADFKTVELTTQQRDRIEQGDRPLRQKLADLQTQSVSPGIAESTKMSQAQFQAQIQRVQDDRRRTIENVLTAEQRSQLQQRPQTRPTISP